MQNRTTVIIRNPVEGLEAGGFIGPDPVEARAFLLRRIEGTTTILPGSWPLRSVGVPRHPQAFRAETAHRLATEGPGEPWWELSNEGPWLTREAAEAFGRDEVGVQWRVRRAGNAYVLDIIREG